MRMKFILSAIVAMLLVPIVSAYNLGLPAMDLWTLFVENTFGGFWIAVVGISVIMFIILMLGSISAWSNFTYQFIFFMAMAMGYGQPLITIPLFIIVVGWTIFQVIKYYNLQ